MNPPILVVFLLLQYNIHVLVSIGRARYFLLSNIPLTSKSNKEEERERERKREKEREIEREKEGKTLYWNNVRG